MARAGRAVADLAVRVAPAARRIAVLVGPGNNGGDGYVAAAELARRGRDVLVWELTERAHHRGRAHRARRPGSTCRPPRAPASPALGPPDDEAAACSRAST